MYIVDNYDVNVAVQCSLTGRDEQRFVTSAGQEGKRQLLQQTRKESHSVRKCVSYYDNNNDNDNDESQ